MQGQDIGYIRVSSVDQNCIRQLDNIKLDTKYIDRQSGKDDQRPKLQECLRYVRQGDTLHVHSIDRLARNLQDLLKIVRDLADKGVAIRFHKENLHFTGTQDPMSRFMLQLFGAVSEFERSLIRERQLEGIAIAKKQGKYKKKEKLTPRQQKEIKRRIESGEQKKALAEEFNVCRQTIYNILK